AIKNVTDEDDLMIINKSGITIRISVEELRTMGRATQGVRLINLRNGDAIAAVAKVDAEDEEEALLEGEDGAVVMLEEQNDSIEESSDERKSIDDADDTDNSTETEE